MFRRLHLKFSFISLTIIAVIMAVIVFMLNYNLALTNYDGSERFMQDLLEHDGHPPAFEYERFSYNHGAKIEKQDSHLSIIKFLFPFSPMPAGFRNFYSGLLNSSGRLYRTISDFSSSESDFELNNNNNSNSTSYDYTKYRVNGSSELLGKGKMALAVMEYLVKDKKETYSEILSDISRIINSKTDRIVIKVEDYPQWKEKYKNDKGKRWYDDYPLTTIDNVKFYFTTQWGKGNIQAILLPICILK